MKIALKTTVVVVLVLYLALSFRSSIHIADHPITEDAYYSLAVAKNITQGHFFSVDGQSQTNGFQPLFTFICAVPYFIAPYNDLITPLRIIIFFGLILMFFSAILFSEIASGFLNAKEDKLMIFLLFLSLPLNTSIFFNGLETGMLTFMLLLDWYVYLKTDFRKAGNVLLLGIVLGLTALTRIDAIWLCVIVSFSVFFRKDTSPKINLRNFLILSLTSFIVESPWLSYNYFVFGSIMPTSGKAQLNVAFDPKRLYHSLNAVLNLLLPNLYLWERILTGISGLIIRAFTLSGILYILLKKKDIIKLIKNGNRNMNFPTAIAMFVIILVIWYTISSWSVHFYLRYFTPLLFLGLLTELTFLYSVFKNKTIIYTMIIMLSIPAIAGVLFLNADIKLRPSVFLTGQLALVGKHVDPKEKVAARQSGTLCYFRQNVVNCDGKVNNDVFNYSGRMTDYLKKNEIRWFCDWKLYADTVLGKEPERKGWIMVDSLNEFILYHKTN